MFLIPVVQKGVAWACIEAAYARGFWQKCDICDAADIDDHPILFIRAEDVLVKGGYQRSALSSESNIGGSKIRDRGQSRAGGYDCARSQLNGKSLLRTMAHGLAVAADGEWGSVQLCHECRSALREGIPQVMVQRGDRI